MNKLLSAILLMSLAGVAAAENAASSCAGDLHKFCAQSGSDMDCLLVQSSLFPNQAP